MIGATKMAMPKMRAAPQTLQLRLLRWSRMRSEAGGNPKSTASASVSKTSAAKLESLAKPPQPLAAKARRRSPASRSVSMRLQKTKRARE